MRSVKCNGKTSPYAYSFFSTSSVHHLVMLISSSSIMNMVWTLISAVHICHVVASQPLSLSTAKNTKCTMISLGTKMDAASSHIDSQTSDAPQMCHHLISPRHEESS